jgi:hypothetical protein
VPPYILASPEKIPKKKPPQTGSSFTAVFTPAIVYAVPLACQVFVRKNPRNALLLTSGEPDTIPEAGEKNRWTFGEPRGWWESLATL